MNAIAELEGALKQTVEEIGSRLTRGKFGFREIRALAWAGMLHEDAELGIRQVGDWLTEAGFIEDKAAREKFATVIFEGLAASFPQAAKTDGEPKN